MKIETRINAFLSRVNATSWVACWAWRGTVNREGYGVVTYNKRRVGAHRMAYLLAYGEVPEGLVMDHLCRVRSCVNPRHLEAVSNRVNVLRGVSQVAENALKTHCKRGHAFTATNTQPTPRGRGCKACKKLWVADKRALAGPKARVPRKECRRGHEYTPENTFIYPAGTSRHGERRCRKCADESRWARSAKASCNIHHPEAAG